MGERGVKETKEFLALLAKVVPVLIVRFKDGVGLDDVMALLEVWKTDEELKAAIKAGVDGAKEIPEEIKDFQVEEVLELVPEFKDLIVNTLNALKK